MNPKVSVILPTYNRWSTLERAIGSVSGQTFTHWELLVVDDGSDDGTQKHLNAIEKSDPRIKALLSPENRGVSAARNRGIKLARGEWIAFLDSDDEWLPEKLARQWRYVQDHPEFSIVHGEEIWIRNGKRVNPMVKHQKRGGDIFHDAVRLCCISPSTVMLRKSLLQEVGLFREDFPVCEDYDLWLKITSRHRVGFIEDFLIKKYGGHQDQLSRRFFAMDYWRIKALKDRLESGALNVAQSRIAEQEIKAKAKILLSGYRKHENLGTFDEVFGVIMSKLEV